VESVDTRDLKSLARLSMRVRVPPVLPSDGRKEQCDKLRESFRLNADLEVFVYTYKGELINIKSLWRQ
jgi:hypothetical protein